VLVYGSPIRKEGGNMENNTTIFQKSLCRSCWEIIDNFYDDEFDWYVIPGHCPKCLKSTLIPGGI
jgi:hypothetical protein